MRAVCWNGKEDVRVETVPDPEIINPRDAITKTELTAICRSDLHPYRVRQCYYCAHELFSFCDNSNPNGGLTEPFYGQPAGGSGDRRKTDNDRPTFRPLAEARRETPAWARKRKPQDLV